MKNCPECNGEMYISIGNTTFPCATCEGTGEVADNVNVPVWVGFVCDTRCSQWLGRHLKCESCPAKEVNHAN